MNTAKTVAYTAYVTSPVGALTGASRELALGTVDYVATGISAYQENWGSAIVDQLGAQGEQGASAVVTEAVLTGGLAAAGRVNSILPEGAAASGAGVESSVGRTLRPGPYAGESIPATGPKLTRTEQAQINRFGQSSGCHTCGTKTPGTKSGNFVGDHQPPKALEPPKRVYPQCMQCSRTQGGEVTAAKRARQTVREPIKNPARK